jgi:hypothetical protein
VSWLVCSTHWTRCSLRKNLKSKTLISDMPTRAHLRSGKVRRGRVGVVQTWMEDGLYIDARVVGALPFFNYRRRALKRQHALANVCRRLLEGGDTH